MYNSICDIVGKGIEKNRNNSDKIGENEITNLQDNWIAWQIVNCNLAGVEYLNHDARNDWWVYDVGESASFWP